MSTYTQSICSICSICSRLFLNFQYKICSKKVYILWFALSPSSFLSRNSIAFLQFDFLFSPQLPNFFRFPILILLLFVHILYQFCKCLHKESRQQLSNTFAKKTLQTHTPWEVIWRILWKIYPVKSAQIFFR